MSLLRRLLGISDDDQSLGARGERHASKWLAARGYRVLDRNVSCGDDEVDILAVDPDGRTIVVVEVKTRQCAQPPPEASVNRTTQSRLARCAARLQRKTRYRDRPFRFDVVAIIWPVGCEPSVQHWPGAFESPF